MKSAALLWLVAVPCLANFEIPSPQQNHPIALLHATVHTMDAPTLSDATLLFDKGKIVALGRDIALPENSERVDVTGLHLYPGFILSSTILGLNEVAQIRSTDDHQELGDFNPMLNAQSSVDLDSDQINVARANGILLSVTTPRGGLLSGNAAAHYLDGWTMQDRLVKAPVGMVLNWPSMSIDHSFFNSQTPEEQIKAQQSEVASLNLFFSRARSYFIARKAFTDKKAKKPLTDRRFDAMIPVFEQQVPLLVYAETMREIEAAVAFCDTQKVKMILVGGYDAWRLPELLKSHHIAVIAAPIHRLPLRASDPYDAAYTLPKKLFEQKIPFAIGGYLDDDNGRDRTLPYHAAMAASFGLPEEEALRAITLYPAQILGLSDRLGSLTPGKDASFIVTTGNPLEVSTQVKMAFIKGRPVSLENRQTRLYEKYKEKARQLKQ